MKNLIKKICSYTGVPTYFLYNSYIELRMALIRLYGNLPIQRIKLRKIKKSLDIKLNLGCGNSAYANWINIDAFFAKHIDLVLDLRRPLPFADNSIRYCYSEHFLEHLYPSEGIKHLADVRRILEPGGIYRVVVPAGIRFVEKYLTGDEEFFKKAFPWEERSMDAIYKILNWEGEHKNIFDFSQLRYIGKKVGFSMIRECTANSSIMPVLRIDKDDPQRIAESLYVEFVK